MLTSDFDFVLPAEQIAQHSVSPRDASKLMVVHKDTQKIQHKVFRDIIEFLRPGDLLVWNNSKVFKARLFGTLMSADGKILRGHEKPVEIFLVRPMENPGVWKVLARPGKHVVLGTKVVFADDFECEVIAKNGDGTTLVQFDMDDESVRTRANIYGSIPIPPYVKDEMHAIENYQTVYAQKEGSVAAPTAGFHFTPELIDALAQKGIEFAEVTLHVGLGTFLPVKTENIHDHTMHSEWVELTAENAQKINTAKSLGQRVIAVGTTTVRSLEGIAALTGYADKRFEAFSGDINIFIHPGFEFQVVDAMITNFHLPKSTLLMLVSAFVGNIKCTLDAYETAVAKGYRFYSFGDAMFICA